MAIIVLRVDAGDIPGAEEGVNNEEDLEENS